MSNVTPSIRHAFDPLIKREQKMLMVPFSLTYKEVEPEKNFRTANPIRADNNFEDSIRNAMDRLILEAYNRGVQNNSRLLSVKISFIHLEAKNHE